MQEIIDFLAKKEVFILFIILLAAILLYIILWVISFIKKKDEKKKLKTNTKFTEARTDWWLQWQEVWWVKQMKGI